MSIPFLRSVGGQVFSGARFLNSELYNFSHNVANMRNIKTLVPFRSSPRVMITDIDMLGKSCLLDCFEGAPIHFAGEKDYRVFCFFTMSYRLIDCSEPLATVCAFNGASCIVSISGIRGWMGNTNWKTLRISISKMSILTRRCVYAIEQYERGFEPVL